jgi:choline dehydrogenase-like flavoprotein
MRPLPAVVRLSALGRRSPFDVCVIGSGPAGAVLGLDLAERGRRVLMLEAGPRRRIWRRGNGDASGSAAADDGYPIAAARCRGVGGTSNLWTGACPRLHPIDFQPNAYTPAGAAWPIGYADLEPFYERAEHTLRVHGGRLSAHHPPRKADLPFPALADGASLRAMMGEVGIVVDDAPVAIGPDGRDYLRVGPDLLPRFAAHASAALACDATVTALHGDASGRITTAQVRDRGGGRADVTARVFVIAAGGLESARLCLLWRIGAADGLAGAGGPVGRYFMEHLRVAFRGALDRPGVRGAGRSHQFYESLKHRGLGSAILGFVTESGDGRPTLRISADVEMWPSAANRVDLAPDLPDPFGHPGLRLSVAPSARDVESVEHVRSLIRGIYRDLGVAHVEEVTGAPGLSRWLSHHMGTCRMGHDPRTSVVDADLRVHGTPNLYVLGSAAFVTGGASNPTLTIAALAHRLAAHLCDRS